MITTKITEFDVYKGKEKIGHIYREGYSDKEFWVCWIVIRKEGPKTISQGLPARHTDQQEAIDALVLAHEKYHENT